jgi:5-methylcytosine-specific restriction endonuclease McrA
VGYGAEDMQNQFQRNKYELLKESCLAYLGGKQCKVCSTDLLPICCYDFHHNKGAKEQEISKMMRTKKSLDNELKKELDKCAVVCANCHRQVTSKLIGL